MGKQDKIQTDHPPQQAGDEHIQPCLDCRGACQPSQVKDGRRRCLECTARRQVASLLDERRITRTFATTWAARLLQDLATFLDELDFTWASRNELLRRARGLFQSMEERYSTRDVVDPGWVQEVLEGLGRSSNWSHTALWAYLREQELVAPADEDRRDQEQIRRVLARVASLPEGFQRAVEVYLNDRVAQRERQRQRKAKHVLSHRTLEHNWQLLSQLVHWLSAHMPQVTGWKMLQEEHVQAYLLTLTPAHREITRTQLYAFFRAARRRHTMAHVPLTYAPRREVRMPKFPALDLERQRALARHIREEGAQWPTEALLTILCFYHALTVRECRELRLADVDLQGATIRVAGRPPVYLADADLDLLQGHLRRRATVRFAKVRTYLFVPDQKYLLDIPVTTNYVEYKIKAFTGYLPLLLRTTCLEATATRYGPQHLVEAFGVSLMHASRFGSLHDALLDAEVRNQQEAYISYTRVSHHGRRSGEEPYGRT